MDSGFYQSASGLMARMRALEVSAQDLANANTTGYRGSRASFETLLAGQEDLLSAAANVVNRHSAAGATRIDFAQGQLQRTGNPLDVAVEGRGFFAVETSRGIRYTRNGNFRVSPERLLVTQDGDKVMGANGPITIVPGVVTVGEDGTISSNGAVAGKLKLAEFDRTEQMIREGSTLFAAPTAAARAANNSRVRQGMLEGPNVNAMNAAVGLITLQRHAEMLQRAMSVFHSEFNKAAVEELPRV